MRLNRLIHKVNTARQLKPHQRLRVLRQQLHEKTNATTQGFAAKHLTPRLSTAFHATYYHTNNTWAHNHWFDVPIQQFPSDLYIYQELISRTRPDFIIQTGVFDGGSALFLAHMLDLADAPASSKVIAVDIKIHPSARALTHPRIRLIEGDSTASHVLAEIESHLADIPFSHGGMVSLDSDHSAKHVFKELNLYARFTGVGNYLVVEDTTVNGHPVLPLHGPGPGEALDLWLPHHDQFERDDALWRRQLFSAHAGGWLRRIK